MLLLPYIQVCLRRCWTSLSLQQSTLPYHSGLDPQNNPSFQPTAISFGANDSTLSSPTLQSRERCTTVATIVDNLPGVKVTIAVGGVDLEEHLDDEEEVSEYNCTRYVLVASGAEFGVKCKIEKGKMMHGDYLQLMIHIDGKASGGMLVASFRLFHQDYTRTKEGEHSPAGLHPWLFNTLETGIALVTHPTCRFSANRIQLKALLRTRNSKPSKKQSSRLAVSRLLLLMSTGSVKWDRSSCIISLIARLVRFMKRR